MEYYLDSPGGGGLPAGFSGERPGRLVELLFKGADKNGDGKVTSEELPNPMLFKRLDANGDGIVTLEEARVRLPQIRKPK